MFSSASTRAAAVINLDVFKGTQDQTTNFKQPATHLQSSPATSHRVHAATAATLSLMMLKTLQCQSSQELALPESQLPHWAAAEH